MSTALWGLVGVAMAVVILGVCHYHNRQVLAKAVARHHTALVHSVLAQSRMLLQAFSDNIEAAKAPGGYLPDPAYVAEDDRVTALALSHLVVGWHNLLVMPAFDVDLLFDEILITGVVEIPGDEGVCIEFQFGTQRNDVVRYFIPDHALQGFITRTHGLGAYLNQISISPLP